MPDPGTYRVARLLRLLDRALTPSTTFCITPGHAPNAVRLALAAPAIEQLDFALRTLADILRTQQDDFDSTE